MPTLLCLTALALTTAISLSAQDADPPVFDVVSVRVSAPGTRESQRVTDTRVDLVNTRLRSVLLVAFRVGASHLAAPEWVNDVRVDINGTLPAGATRAQVPAMLQTLLRERFALVTHVEPRPVRAYELVRGEGEMKMLEVEPVDEVKMEVPPDPSGKPTIGVSFEPVDGPVRSWVIPGVAGTRTITARTRYDRLFTAGRIRAA